MSDDSTNHMLQEYMEQASTQGFLSGMFQTPPRNFYTAEKLEMDVMREDEDVATPLPSVNAGANLNASTKYTNKSYDPAVYNEAIVVNAAELMKRFPGESPYDDPNFAAHLSTLIFQAWRKGENKLRRATELQASQVLQTGKLSLKDKTGAVILDADFQPKATHIKSVTTAWSAGGADPLADLEPIGNTIRQDGKRNPNRLIFGSTAWTNFIANSDVKERWRKDGLPIGELRRPRQSEAGGTLHGYIAIGSYDYELWTYTGFYKDPQTGDVTTYIDPNKVVMMSTGARLDATFGSIPLVAAPDPRVMRFLPSSVASTERGFAMTTNAWITQDNTSIVASAGARVLMIPTEIDTFACLTTTV